MLTACRIQSHICPFFFFNHTSPTEIYTLSLHDALPILLADPRADNLARHFTGQWLQARDVEGIHSNPREDRKSTRLNSSHLGISYAVFCLKKKKQNN